MSGIVIAVTALSAAAAAVPAVWLRARGQTAATAQSPRFSVAAVGFEKAGKTVYLGSMFDTLRVPGSAGVGLATAPEYEGRLMALHRRTSNTHEPFPDATAKGNYAQWPFTVFAKSPGKVIDVAEFTYLDFAGETLRDMYAAPPNPVTRELNERFLRADVLMGMLDGAMVKHFLDGRAATSFFEDMGTLLSLLSRHPRPTQLILTKWDILEDHYTFPVIVERLLQIPNFRNFVGSQTAAGGTCRLIPISSVGKGFVRQEGEVMVKEAGKQVQPTMTEIPMACAVSDLVDLARTATARNSDAAPSPGALGVSLAFGPLHFDLRDPGAFRRVVPWSIHARASDAKRDAAVRLLTFCSSQVRRLELAYPDSSLSKFVSGQEL